MERALACGASRHEAGQAVVRAGVRAALERLVQHTSGPGLLLLPALAAGLLLAGVPPMLVGSAEHDNSSTGVKRQLLAVHSCELQEHLSQLAVVLCAAVMTQGLCSAVDWECTSVILY